MKRKKIFNLLLTGIIVIEGFSIKSQTVSTFENLLLNPNSYWNGNTIPMGTSFSSGNAIFPNVYNSAYGGYWESGWAYSNMKDSITSGFSNMYSARPAIGCNNSSNYLVGQNEAIINLNPTAIGKVINGFYVTNGTFAAISMRDGDFYAKKFGGTSGNDADWFKLTIRKWFNGVFTNDSVEFYLADYRFSNNEQDYILKTWQWVDLTSLGNVDSLKFMLTSSDNGAYGMNTPAFFCLDNFTTSDSFSSVNKIDSNNSLISIFPNPASEYLKIDLKKFDEPSLQLNIFDKNGKNIFKENINNLSEISINISDLKNGLYIVNIVGTKICANKIFVKN